MGSVNDIGTPGSPLNTPPLTAWQAAVRDALNSEDVTVNDRLEASEADMRLYTDSLITISDVPPTGVPSRDGLLWIVVF